MFILFSSYNEMKYIVTNYFYEAHVNKNCVATHRLKTTISEP